MRCEEAAGELAGFVEVEAAASHAVRDHVQTCLRCQAEVAGYRRLRRSLRDLEWDHVPPDDALLEELLSHVGPDAEVHRLRPRGLRVRRLRQRVGLGGVHVRRPSLRAVGVTAASVVGAVAGGAALASRVMMRSATG